MAATPYQISFPMEDDSNYDNLSQITNENFVENIPLDLPDEVNNNVEKDNISLESFKEHSVTFEEKDDKFTWDGKFDAMQSSFVVQNTPSKKYKFLKIFLASVAVVICVIVICVFVALALVNKDDSLKLSVLKRDEPITVHDFSFKLHLQRNRDTINIKLSTAAEITIYRDKYIFKNTNKGLNNATKIYISDDVYEIGRREDGISINARFFKCDAFSSVMLTNDADVKIEIL